MPAGTHVAAAVEDALNRRLIHFLRNRGWRPRTIAHTGYGSPDFVRILGRVVMTRNPLPESDAEADAPAKPVRGWRPYVTAPVGMIPVTVTIDGRDHHTRADRGGYIDLSVHGHGLAPGWHQVTLRARASTPVPARVRIISSRARVGLISDIDDTVMITAVPRPLIAVWNTFVRHHSSRRVVPGMARFYRRVEEQVSDLPVFYLSTGAWNVVPAIAEFLHEHDYPFGPKLMTDWGPTNTGWFRSGREHKERTLRRLHTEFPHVRWVLVGDDGQRDPAIYAEFAQEFPGAVAAIAIRQLTPGEQILSHGTPVALPDADRRRGMRGAPQFLGGDGVALAPQVLNALADAAPPD
ncbi:App1 family protein [Pseudactinotalea sp. Z1732]|uniref:App1 family protein n=1 Tax=Pseudactinotalea sp. Z1732 TaxID=3413026 RepID=UPI003C7EC3BF